MDFAPGSKPGGGSQSLMHDTLYDKLRIDTFLVQFFWFLTRGYIDEKEQDIIKKLIDDNIEKLLLLRDNLKWNGRYDLVMHQIFASEDFIRKSRPHIKYKQICEDVDIANYLAKNPQFFEEGIALIDLAKLFDIDALFRNGYMRHDVFGGYPERDMYSFRIDCIDYLYSAAHFYNEGYDYYTERKVIKFYDDESFQNIHPFEMKRIQPKEEVAFRNFREAFINIIFFIESFINSVGIDAFLAGLAKNEIDEYRLKGIEKIKNGWKTYSNLKQRIRNFSEIINGIPLDPEQEPFKTYTERSVELRNQYVHSGNNTIKSLRTPDDWKKKCDEMIDHGTFEVLTAFWKGCYPTKPFPRNIFNDFYGNSFKGHQGRFVMEE